MNKKTTLYIVQGFIGAGKSTFSRELSKKTGAIHLNVDTWVSKLYNKKSNYDWNKRFDETVILLWDKTKDLLLNGFDVIFDMGFWFKKDRIFAKQLAQECKSNFKHYYIYAPDEILKKRIMADRPPKWAKMHLQNFDENKNLFEEPLSDENPIIINNF